jgi:hypothetical protein
MIDLRPASSAEQRKARERLTLRPSLAQYQILTLKLLSKLIILCHHLYPSNRVSFLTLLRCRPPEGRQRETGDLPRRHDQHITRLQHGLHRYGLNMLSERGEGVERARRRGRKGLCGEKGGGGRGSVEVYG